MKIKKWTALTLGVILAVLAMTGCGSSAEDEIKQAAETFLSAASRSDAETVRSVCSEEALSEEVMSIFDVQALENELYESFSIEKEVLDADVQTQMTDICQKLSGQFIQKYTVKKATVKDGTGTVEADVTYGYDIEKLFDSEEIEQAVENFTETYMDENQEELMSIYFEEGEDAVYAKINNDLMPVVLSALNDVLENPEPVEEELCLDLEQIDGEWKITQAYTYE